MLVFAMTCDDREHRGRDVFRELNTTSLRGRCFVRASINDNTRLYRNSSVEEKDGD